MMIEFWWKVFLASLITVVVAELFGCPLGILALFAFAWIFWTVCLLLLLWLSDWWMKRRHGRSGRP